MNKCAVLRFRFGGRARILLERSARSTNDLATLSKLPAARVAKILDGSYARITIKEMDLIARALETPLYRLLAPMEASDVTAATYTNEELAAILPTRE